MRGEGLLSFCNGCGNGKVRCNGRGKPTPLRRVDGIVQMQNPKTQTDDCITKSDGDSADAKQTERSYVKCGSAERGMVRKISLMVRMRSNPHRLDGKSIAILETVR